MSTSIKSGIVFGICTLLVVFSAASGQEKEDKKDFNIVGNYRVVGTEDGTEYSGNAKITAHGKVFKIQFTGESVENGIGIFDGKTFSVCFVSEGDSEENSKGIVVFKLQKDNKTLAGKYAYMDGDGELYTETLTKVE